MLPETEGEIVKFVKSSNISSIRLWFTDVLGQLKGFSITPKQLKGAFEEGSGFDGSSVEGFCRIEESDLLAKPDPNTFRMIPWQPNGEKTAAMFCDILNPDGKPYEGDPRFVLKKNLEKAKKKGFVFYVGPELEYFYFKDNNGTDLLDRGGYFDSNSNTGAILREKTVTALEKMDVPVEYMHHEVAPSSHEIDLEYKKALEMADSTMTYRFVVKEIAQADGFYATFMPKPVFGVNGSGMHVHQSLFKDKKNVFFNKNDKYNLSKTAGSYVEGILKYVNEVVIVTNQWVNSYKRIVPGFEAPAYIAWGQKNRSALVRIPRYKPGKEKSTRVEARFPDPACNPYLAFSVMLAAGLKGVEENLKLREPVENDIYNMSQEERKKLNIGSLPSDLHEAISYAEKSKLLKETLGEHVFKKIIANKKAEWDRFRRHVTDFELKEYLAVL